MLINLIESVYRLLWGDLFTIPLGGGIGILPGAMIGGFVMGIAESLTKSYISSQMSDAVVYGILIIMLLVKPPGLLGKRASEKV